MKKPTIITTFNDNPTYLSFVRSIVQMWNNFGYDIKIGYITDNPNNDILTFVKKYADVDVIPRDSEIDSGVQSKVTRMIMASNEDFFWIVDVDFYILNIKWWEDKFKLYTGNNIVSAETYSDNHSKGKWPMWSNLGSGSVLRSIINPNNLSYNSLLDFWKSIDNKYDNKENIKNEFSKFSDESLLRRLVTDSNHSIERYNRNTFAVSGNRQDYYKNIIRRIDRTWNWQVDDELLYSGHYLDCFPKRPLTDDDVIRKIFNFLKIEI